MQPPIKTGIFSYGMSGKLFQAPFVNAHPGFELTGIAERSEKKAQQQYPAIKSYDSIDELLADPELELVIVNTPTLTHFEMAQKALQAGKHVMVEKPFTVTSYEAAQLFAEAKQLGLHILPYQNRRYDSDFLSVKEVIDSGKLGRLVEVHVRYDRYRHHIGPKVAKETPVPGAGLFYDLGPHMLDIVLNLFGKPLDWTTTLGGYRPNTLVDDYCYIHLKYPENLNVFVTISMLVADEQPAFVINGTRGSFIKQRSDTQEKQLLKNMSPNDPAFGVEEPGKEGLLTVISEDGVKTRTKIAGGTANYLNLFESVYQTIRNGQPFAVTEAQIIQQLSIIEKK